MYNSGNHFSNSLKNNHWRYIVLLILLTFFLFFFRVGERALADPEEGRYAEIAREMVESGDWTTPRLNYIKRFNIPPLVYWGTAASIRIFGLGNIGDAMSNALTGPFKFFFTGGNDMIDEFVVRIVGLSTGLTLWWRSFWRPAACRRAVNVRRGG